jgi:hypothetical protein
VTILLHLDFADGWGNRLPDYTSRISLRQAAGEILSLDAPAVRTSQATGGALAGINYYALILSPRPESDTITTNEAP